MATEGVTKLYSNPHVLNGLGRVLGAIALAGQLLASAGAHACTLPMPKERVILTVSGKIEECNDGAEVTIDLKMLESLPSTAIATKTPWDRGKAIYQGVLLRDLMKFVKAKGLVASVEALNDYHADIALSDMEKEDVILAYRRDGFTLSVKEKGPLLVVFPLNTSKVKLADLRFAQSVWQVHRIELK